jgi:hypothetical protein
VTGDGRSDLVVATGHSNNYALDCPDEDPDDAFWWDGFVYCYAPNAQGVWSQSWRYPSTLVTDEFGRLGGYPAYVSGAAVGRLRGNDLIPGTQTVYPPAVVAVDMSGRVVALDGRDGSELWTFDIPWDPSVPASKAQHRDMRGSVTQPLILDINGDSYEDVIVGTSSGWIWFLNGHPSGSQGESLAGHPPIHTIRSADSTTREGMVERQYEEVRGLAVGPLKSTPTTPSDGQTRSILLVTSGRAGLVYPPQVGGHAFLFDLGAGSWNPNAASWPQFGQNAQHTGHYPGP